MPPETRTIRQKVLIPAAPTEVYDALMDPKKHSAFTGSEAGGSSEIGGTFTAWDGYIAARNLELVRGEKIVQEWTTTEWPEGYPPSLLEIRPSKVEGGTELELVQSRVPVDQTDDYERGWHEHYWGPMREHFLKGRKLKKSKS